jgi:hypothetical protein
MIFLCLRIMATTITIASIPSAKRLYVARFILQFYMRKMHPKTPFPSQFATWPPQSLELKKQYLSPLFFCIV